MTKYENATLIPWRHECTASSMRQPCSGECKDVVVVPAVSSKYLILASVNLT